MDDALKNVTQILTSRRDALFAVAERLMVIEAMNGEELRQIIEDNSRGPQVVPGTGDSPKRAGRGVTEATCERDFRRPEAPCTRARARGHGCSC